ncbi:hypothetical protein M422DRAFT_259019 [Sphaerobolus stellatus SS14]|uniref:Uncharacterized protein n=1 Tax=Sphaerobolus stellatus (strain SS14) TaxID=990650 RepID=A0A0C9VA27_SPHS4|nr:hypothetical protein M422DRAFT_259019 [Sphaerobolus stellatus SS14]
MAPQQRHSPTTNDDIRSATHRSDLRKEQVEKNVLAIEVKELTRQLADADNRESVTQHPCHRRRKAAEIPDKQRHTQVKDIAHKFTYMSILWLHQPSETFQLSLDEEYDPLSHFISEDGFLQGQLWLLLEVIPGDLHEEMNDDIFINTFTAAMHQQRSNASTRVRPDSGTAIFRCTDEEFANRADNFKDLIGWSSKDDGYKVLAPILFKDYNKKMDKWKIFRNPILMCTYATLMLGPSSIKKAKGNSIYVHHSLHSSLEPLWGIRAVTPAAIATSAILACFSASADHSFQPIGQITQIHYQNDFKYYLKYLCEGLPEFPKQINHSTVEEGLDDIINDLYDEAEQVLSDSDREDHGIDQENSKGVESPQIGDSERDNHGTNTENSKEVEKLEMVTVSERSPSPLMDIEDKATLCRRHPNQLLCLSSLLPDTQPRKKSNGKRKIIAVMDSQDEEGQKNVPPKKVHKKQSRRARKEATQPSLHRSMHFH